MTKKTKIICTIGPATWEPDTLKEIINAGMNMARINASFADAQEIERVTKLIRSVSDDVAILLDLKGHKIRISDIGEPIQVQAGEDIVISTDQRFEGIVVSYGNLHNDIKPGEKILIDDGKVRLEVKEIKGTEIICTVQNTSIIKRLKTVNTPGVKLSFEPLTEKDKIDIETAVNCDVDYIAGSFVRDLNDVHAIKERIPEEKNIKLIAKIEDPLGVEHFDEILSNVDGIMVARGDLGVEVPYAKVPLLQKEFIYKCNEVAKPVIVATHMLESMVQSPAPTRAEVSDVANAIYDGTDCVMLSAETSTGEYPVDAVNVLANVAKEVEPSIDVQMYDEDEQDILSFNGRSVDDFHLQSAMAVTKAQVALSRNINLSSIIVLSKRGFTARLLSRLKLQQPIYAFVPDKKVERQLNLSWGVKAFCVNIDFYDREEALRGMIKLAKSKGLVQEGELVSLVIGSQVFQGNRSSILELEKVT